jgi:multidrug efflux pump subunit AcrA (membrane-fusion protein)
LCSVALQTRLKQYMASKAIYGAVAVVGIAAASGAAYWFQNKPRGPQEIAGAAPAASAPAGAPGAAGGRGGAPGGPAGVEVAKVEKTTLQDDAQSVGSLRSRRTVMLRPEVAGRISQLGFSDGARIRKGQLLVQLDDVLQKAEVQQAQAQVSIQRANFMRNQELVAQNFVAQRVLDESAANVQVAEAQMALACARLERMRIIAPFDATTSISNVSVGDYVKDGADLVNLEDLSSMYVDFRLPERFQNRVRREQVVELQLDAFPNRAFKAKIEVIDPQLDANGRSVLVRATLPNTSGEAAVRPAGAGAGGPGAAPGPAGAASGPAAAASAQPKRAAPRPPARADASAESPRPSPSPEAQACAGLSASAGQAGVRPGSRAAASGQGGQAGAQRPGAAAATKPVPAAPTAKGGGGGGGAGPLRPGMFARVTAVFQIKDDALVVPEEAIVPQGGRQFVIKLVEQTEAEAKALAEQAAQAASAAAPASAPVGSGGNAMAAAAAPAAPTGFVDGKRLVSKRQEVRLGIRRAGKVEIVEGVSEGEQVVVAGQQRLQRDATPVRIVELGRPGGQGTVPGPQPTASAPSNPASR